MQPLTPTPTFPPQQQHQQQQLQPPAPPSPKIIINHHRRPNINNNNINNDDDGEGKKFNAEYGKISNGISNCELAARENINKNDNVQNESDEEEEASILPEMLKNQIKIEPISEDEEEMRTQEGNHHINNNTSNSFNHHDAPQYNNKNNTNSNESVINNHANASDGSDPNQQLMVLSNPRIGDGPGEYLCNVCQAKFVYKNNLKSHLKRHLGIYP